MNEMLDQIFLPITRLGIFSFLAPSALGYMINYIGRLRGAPIENIYAMVYPGVLVMVLSVMLVNAVQQLFVNVVESVRDEHFMVGRRLHNVNPQVI